MRLLIIGLDGCELNFVEQFKCRNLMQAEYGKVSIPKECFIMVPGPDGSDQKLREPWTPYVWYSFITGSSKKFAYETRWTFEALNRIPYNRKLRSVLKRLGFKQRMRDKRECNDPTIFDLASSPVDIDVPTYSIGWSIFFGLSPKDFPHFHNFIEEAIQRNLSRFYNNYIKLIHHLKRESWDLLMFYAKILDTIGELKISEPQTLQKYYQMIDTSVWTIKQLFHGYLLIISDHGICRWEGTKWGKHSDYAFYSLNKRLNLSNPSMTDFYAIIERLLNL